MLEYLDYIGDAMSRAFSHSLGRISAFLALTTVFIGFIVYFLFGWDSSEITRSVTVVFFTFLFFFFVQVTRELRTMFARIFVEKSNSVVDARIIIFNNEVSDLENLQIEMIKQTRVYLDGRKENIPLDHEGRFLEVEGERVVSYDGGSKVVIVATVKDETAFLGNEMITECECYEGWYYAIYDVVFRIKGKIDGKTVHPKKVTGRLKFAKSCEKTYAYIQGKKVETYTARFQWVDIIKPDET